MRLNEDIASARRVGPLLALDASGDPVLLETFAGAGELEVSLGGAAFGAAAGTIVEIGQGYYYLQATLADAAALWIAAKIGGTACEEFTMREDIERVCSGIALNEADASKRRIGPLLALDSSGNEILEAAIGAITVEISINGSVWAAAAGTLSFTDDGYLYYNVPLAELTERGWICVKLSGTAEEFTMREDVVDVTAPVVAVVSPDAGEPPGDPGAMSTDYDIAKVTPLLVDIPDASGLAYVAVFATLPTVDGKLCVYRRSAFEAPFDLNSFTSVPVAGTLRLHVRHNSDWPPGDVTLDFDAVDGNANLNA